MRIPAEQKNREMEFLVVLGPSVARAEYQRKDSKAI